MNADRPINSILPRKPRFPWPRMLRLSGCLTSLSHVNNLKIVD